MGLKANKRLHLCFFLLFFLCLQFNNSTLLSFNEGDVAEMVFQYYDLNDADVSLKMPNRPKFYHSGTMSMGGLTPRQRNRFSVKEKTHRGDGTHRNIHMIRVRINNVTREDAGTFICNIHQNGEKQDALTKEISLHVEFPPGKATCEIDDSFDEMNEAWIRVKCRAPVGSIPGYIDCYQDGEKMPPWNRPLQDRTTFTQTLWIKRVLPAHCCTSNYDKPTEKCQCKDFGWDPFKGTTISENIQDPCPTPKVLTATDIVTPKGQGNIEISYIPKNVTQLNCTKLNNQADRTCSNQSVIWFIGGVITGILLTLVILYFYNLINKLNVHATTTNRGGDRRSSTGSSQDSLTDQTPKDKTTEPQIGPSKEYTLTKQSSTDQTSTDTTSVDPPPTSLTPIDQSSTHETSPGTTFNYKLYPKRKQYVASEEKPSHILNRRKEKFVYPRYETMQTKEQTSLSTAQGNVQYSNNGIVT